MSQAFIWTTRVSVLLKPGNVLRRQRVFIPFTSLSLHPWEGSLPPPEPSVWPLQLGSPQSLSLFFSLRQVPVCWSKAARFTTNPLCDHSYCKLIVCQVGSDTHTSRLHNHALFHRHNTLDWFIIVQLPLTRRLCLQKHFHIHPYARIDCYSPLTDKLLLHARPLFNAVLR